MGGDGRAAREAGVGRKWFNTKDVQTRTRGIFETDQLATADLADDRQIVTGNRGFHRVSPAGVVHANASQVSSHTFR